MIRKLRKIQAASWLLSVLCHISCLVLMAANVSAPRRDSCDAGVPCIPCTLVLELGASSEISDSAADGTARTSAGASNRDDSDPGTESPEIPAFPPAETQPLPTREAKDEGKEPGEAPCPAKAPPPLLPETKAERKLPPSRFEREPERNAASAPNAPPASQTSPAARKSVVRAAREPLLADSIPRAPTGAVGPEEQGSKPHGADSPSQGLASGKHALAANAPQEKCRIEMPTPTHNPPPRYPRQAIRRGQSGRVLLSVEILRDGSVGEVEVRQSSGHRALDTAARNAVRTWRFQPARRNGIPFACRLEIPIAFRIPDGGASRLD